MRRRNPQRKRDPKQIRPRSNKNLKKSRTKRRSSNLKTLIQKPIQREHRLLQLPKNQISLQKMLKVALLPRTKKWRSNLRKIIENLKPQLKIIRRTKPRAQQKVKMSNRKSNPLQARNLEEPVCLHRSNKRARGSKSEQ